MIIHKQIEHVSSEIKWVLRNGTEDLVSGVRMWLEMVSSMEDECIWSIVNTITDDSGELSLIAP